VLLGNAYSKALSAQSVPSEPKKAIRSDMAAENLAPKDGLVLLASGNSERQPSGPLLLKRRRPLSNIV